MSILIIDGFVDEPTCLGVPPFISTYVRYVAGALVTAGVKDIKYITISDLREDFYYISNFKNVIIIAGNPVPGKYLGGIPISFQEIQEIALTFPHTHFFVGGPIQFEGVDFKLPNITLVEKDLEAFLYDYFYHSATAFRYRTIEELERFALEGAWIVTLHPRFPDIIVEIETSRGCPRERHCSFCVEQLYGVEFRKPYDILKEIRKLASYGVRHFRIGKQSDIISYGSFLKRWKNGFPQPNPLWIEILYEGIREEVPGLLTLHLDNVNPGSIANFPDESAKILETISNYNTPGDVAALGMESADPKVIEKNFLKAQPDEVYLAVKMINEIGGYREKGIPKLLPGINIIRGLPGENKQTFKKNYEFLLKIKEDGLLLRRINIRQLKISPFTYLGKLRQENKDEKILMAIFKNYREKIRKEIDSYMLKKVFPPGTLLENVIVEGHRGEWSLARQIGTYPIIVNIPKKIPLLSKLNSFVVNYRERSIVGLPSPFILDEASIMELKHIPGFEKQATKFFLTKEKTMSQLESLSIFQYIKPYIKLSRYNS